MSTPATETHMTTLNSLLRPIEAPIAVYDGQLAHVYSNSAYASLLTDGDAANAADVLQSSAHLQIHRGFFQRLEPYVEQRLAGIARGFPLCDLEGRMYLVEVLQAKGTQTKPRSPSNQISTESGNAAEAIKLDGLSAAWFTAQLSSPTAELAPPRDLRGRIEKVEGLPCLPAVAQRILALASNPNATLNDLARLVESDPMLAAQLLRWASSPYYGQRNKLKSIDDAIRVVGFDIVINLALGVASLKELRVPKEGPLGLATIWRHALYTATLMSQLADRIAVSPRPPAGLAYLAGLMHNLGLFLLGHQFPREFGYLNRLVASNPNTPIATLEKFAFGTDHARLGTWLLSLWGLPESICVAVAHHHNLNYAGSNVVLSNLILLSDHALATAGIGDGSKAPETMDQCCTTLGIANTKVQETLEQVLEKGDILDAFAQQLAPA